MEEVILSGLSIQKSLTSRFTPEQKEKGKQIISRMGLEGLEHRSIGQLSGGQLQRALLGRAIISDPAVLILDEPSTYIDKRFVDASDRFYLLQYSADVVTDKDNGTFFIDFSQ